MRSIHECTDLNCLALSRDLINVNVLPLVLLYLPLELASAFTVLFLPCYCHTE